MAFDGLGPTKPLESAFPLEPKSSDSQEFPVSSTEVIDIENFEEESLDVVSGSMEFEELISIVDEMLDKETVLAQSEEIGREFDEMAKEIFAEGELEEWEGELNRLVEQEGLEQALKVIVKQAGQVKPLTKGGKAEDLSGVLNTASERLIKGILVGNVVKRHLKLVQGKDEITEYDALMEDLQSAAFEGAETLLLGMKIPLCCMLGERLKRVKERRDELQLMIDQESDEELKSSLQNEWVKLDSEAKALEEDLQGRTKDLSYSFLQQAITGGGLTTDVLSAEALSSYLEFSENILFALAETGASLDMAGSLVGLGWRTYKAYSSCKKLRVLNENIHFLEQEVAQLEKSGDPEVSAPQIVVLKAKIDRMRCIKRELNKDLTMSGMGVLASGLAVTTAIKGILVASGVAMGAAASACFTATGIGAGALGGALVIGGIGYGVYKGRHDIEYWAKVADIPLRKHFNAVQLKRVEGIYDTGLERIRELSRTLESTPIFLEESEQFMEEIETSTSRLQKIKQNLQDQREEIEITIQQVGEELSAKEIRADRIEEQMDTLLQTMNEATDALGKKEAVEANEQVIRGISALLDDLNTDLEKIADQIESLKKTEQVLKRELVQIDNKIAENEEMLVITRDKREAAYKQVAQLSERMERAEVEILERSERVEAALSTISQTKETLGRLGSRETAAASQKAWKKKRSKFSSYDIATLKAVEGILQEAVADPEKEEALAQLLTAHGFRPTRPLAFEGNLGVLAFILDDHKVTKQILRAEESV